MMDVYYNCIVHLPKSFGIEVLHQKILQAFTKKTFGAAKLLLRRVVEYSEW